MSNIFYGINYISNKVPRYKTFNSTYKGVQLGKTDTSFQGKVYHIGNNIIMISENGLIKTLKG